MTKNFELSVNDELRNLVPKMNESEFEALKESIFTEGQKIPIDVMSDGTIIDGHNRFDACGIVGVEPKYVIVKEITTIEQAKHYAFITNAKRRQMPKYVIAEYGIINMASGDATVTLDKVSLAVGVPVATLDKVSRIVRQASEEVKQRLRSSEGKLSINGVYNSLGLSDEVREKLKFAGSGKKGEDIKTVIENRFIVELASPETLSKTTVDHIYHDINDIKGLPSSTLKEIPYPEDRFKTVEEADEYAVKLGGRCKGKFTKVYWMLNVDPIKAKEAE
jgi:hypothetical protein